MKKFYIVFFLLFFILIFSTQYSRNDWKIYTLTSNITDIDGDLTYIYAIGNTGLIVIDKFNDSINPLLSFRTAMGDIPFKNLIVDKFDAYNIYFTGSNLLYHYDWFNDTFYFTTIGDIKAKAVSRIGLSQKNIYVQIGDNIYYIEKIFLNNNHWEIAEDTADIYWKEDVSDLNNYMDYLPHYIYFNNRQYNYTVAYSDLNYIWFGTNGAGLIKLDKSNMKKRQLMIGTGAIKNKAMAIDSVNSIWIAGYNSIYIARYFPDSNKFQYFPTKDIAEIADNDILFISCSKNNVLFCTESGQAFFYSLKKRRFYNIKNENAELLYRAAPLDKYKFIVSNTTGLAIIDTKSKKYYNTGVLLPSIIDVEVYKDSIYVVSNNTLYGAEKKKMEFNKMEFDFPIFTVFNYFRNDTIQIILDNAYIHYKYKDDSLFNSYPVKGMFGDLYSLVYDSNNIWISGRDGIGRLFLSDKHWKNYNRKTCPLTKHFTYALITYNGYLYGVTTNTFFKFFYSNPILHE